MPTLLGVFDEPLRVAALAEKLRNRGYDELEVFSPVPSHELDRAVQPGPSGVRAWTLVGGLLGALTGFFITIWMSNDWQILVGGKPYASVAPYVIIGFELTILFGGLATALGLFVVGGLPKGVPGVHEPGYDARFSADEFGLVVRCEDRDVSEVDSLLRAHAAKEVTVVA